MALAPPRPEVFAWQLPYEAWDDEAQIALLSDPTGDSFAAFFRADPFAVDLASPEALGLLAQHLSSVFRAVPEESTLQLILVCRQTAGRELRRWLDRRAAVEPILRRRAEQRADFLRSFWIRTQGGPLFAKDLDLYVTLRSSAIDIPWSMRDPTDAETRTVMEARRRFVAAAEDLASAAAALGMPLVRMDSAETFGLLWTLLNPTAALAETRPTPHAGSPISGQLLSAPLRRNWEAGTIELDGMHAAVLTPYAPPPTTTAGQFTRELVAGATELALVDRIPFGWLSISLVKPDQEHYKLKLAVKNRAAVAQSGWSAPARQIAHDTQEMRDALSKGHHHAFHAFIHIVLGAADPAVLSSRVREVRSTLASLGFLVVAEDAYTDAALRMSLPAGVAPLDGPRDGMGRAISLTDLGAAQIAPVYMGPRSTPSPDHVWLDRRGRVVTTSLFDNAQGVGHTIVVGPTGSGKSVVVKGALITDILAQGGYVIVLNRHTMGRDTNDYLRYAEQLGDIGQFVDFDVDDPPNLDICAGPYDASMNLFLTHYLSEVLTLGKPQFELRPAQVNAISEKVTEAYEYHSRHHGGRIKMRDIRDMMQGSEEPVTRELGRALAMFTDEGPYAGFVDGERSDLIRPGARFICYELSGIANHPEIRLPTIMALFYKASRFFHSLPTDVPKLFVSEEAAALLLESPRTADLLQKMERLYRKMRAAVVLVTQHARDLDTPQGRALLGDKANLLLLRHDADEAADTTRFLNLTPEQERALQGLDARLGYFSQILMLTRSVQGVVHMLPGPHMYWWLTSDARDLAAFKRAAGEQAGLDVEGLIDRLAAKYPWGVANA